MGKSRPLSISISTNKIREFGSSPVLVRDKWWNRELTLKCKFKCYLNPWITHWELALVKGIREPHEVKKKSFDLGGNRTHDLRIRSTVTLPTELRGRTEKVLKRNSPITTFGHLLGEIEPTGKENRWGFKRGYPVCTQLCEGRVLFG